MMPDRASGWAACVHVSPLEVEECVGGEAAVAKLRCHCECSARTTAMLSRFGVVR